MLSSPCLDSNTPHLTSAAFSLCKYSPHSSLDSNIHDVTMLPPSHIDSLLITLRLWYLPPDHCHNWTSSLPYSGADNQWQNALFHNLCQDVPRVDTFFPVWALTSPNETELLLLWSYTSIPPPCQASLLHRCPPYPTWVISLHGYLPMQIPSTPGIKLPLYMDVLLTSIRLQQLEITYSMFSYHSELKLKINI